MICIPRLGHEGTCTGQKCVLVVRIVSSGVSNVIQNLLSVQAISLCNGEEANGTECTLRVNIETFALATSHANWQLARHSKGVAQLGLSGPKLAKHLGNRTSLDSTCCTTRSEYMRFQPD